MKQFIKLEIDVEKTLNSKFKNAEIEQDPVEKFIYNGVEYYKLSYYYINKTIKPKSFFKKLLFRNKIIKEFGDGMLVRANTIVDKTQENINIDGEFKHEGKTYYITQFNQDFLKNSSVKEINYTGDIIQPLSRYSFISIDGLLCSHIDDIEGEINSLLIYPAGKTGDIIKLSNEITYIYDIAFSTNNYIKELILSDNQEFWLYNGNKPQKTNAKTIIFLNGKIKKLLTREGIRLNLCNI